MIYVFEGLPGAGKTSIISRLSEMLRNRNPIILPEYLPQSYGDRTDISFYVNNEKNKSKIMGEIRNQICLCDRYWYSSAVYCSASSNAYTVNEIMQIYKILHKENIFEKYIYIYLKVSKEVSIERAQIPDVTNMWSTPSFCSRAYDLYETIFNNLNEITQNVVDKMVIDIEKNSVNDICTELFKYIY